METIKVDNKVTNQQYLSEISRVLHDTKFSHFSPTK